MLGIPGVTLVVIGIVGGIGTASTFAVFKVAQKIGNELKPGDLLPMPPPYPPVPRFLYTKPGLADKLRKTVN